MVQVLHPQANSKPKLFEVESRHQGGSLSARCECGWYCNHNHKAVDQAEICVARHVIDVKGLEGEVSPRSLAESWGSEGEEE